MRKLFSSILIGLLFSVSTPFTALASDANAWCIADNSTSYDMVKTLTHVQQFVPTVSTIDKVALTISGFQFSGKIGIQILDGDNVIGSLRSTLAFQAASLGSMGFDIGPISVTPGKTYGLRLTQVDPNDGALYWYKNVDASKCKNQSLVIINGGPEGSFRMGFTIFGYTPAPTPTPVASASSTVASTAQAGSNDVTTLNSTSSQTPTGAPDAALNPTAMAGTGEPPASKTSSSIIPPADFSLLPGVSDTKPVLSLSWSLSTSGDISGYKIFKSEKSTSGFTNVAIIDPKVSQFIDAEVELDKTYYYFIRSYKDTDESVSTITLSAQPSSDAPEIAPTLTTSTDTPASSKASLLWYVIPAIIVLLGAATIYYFRVIKRKKK